MSHKVVGKCSRTDTGRHGTESNMLYTRCHSKHVCNPHTSWCTLELPRTDNRTSCEYHVSGTQRKKREWQKRSSISVECTSSIYTALHESTRQVNIHIIWYVCDIPRNSTGNVAFSVVCPNLVQCKHVIRRVAYVILRGHTTSTGK